MINIADFLLWSCSRFPYCSDMNVLEDTEETKKDKSFAFSDMNERLV